jgi:hypothetical protein
MPIAARTAYILAVASYSTHRQQDVLSCAFKQNQHVISCIFKQNQGGISCILGGYYLLFVLNALELSQAGGITMILWRKIYQNMLDWKNESNGTSTLMLDGASRVGKSFICEQFGKNEYKNMILVDLGIFPEK